MSQLYDDIKQYGYLFPFRDNIPVIKTHLFSDIHQLNVKLDKYIISKMLDINYIGWTTKVLLNIELFPLQMAIIKKMWTAPFPMLVASRGGSKSFLLAIYAILKAIFEPGTKIVIVGSGLRQSKLIFNYMETIWNSSPMLRSIVGGGKNSGPRQSVDQCYFRIGSSIIVGLPVGDGCVNPYTAITYDDSVDFICRDNHDIDQKQIVKRNRQIWGNGQFQLSDEAYCNGIKSTKIITTNKGYSIEGTYNHKIKIIRDNNIVWERFDQIRVGDSVLIDRSKRWHAGETNIGLDEAYCAGLLVGNGCYTNRYNISYRTIDPETASYLRVFGDFLPTASDPTKYVLYGKQKCDNILDKIGTTLCYAHEKYIPKNILKSNKNIIASFLSGVFDTDSGIQLSLDKKDKKSLSCRIQYSSTSKRLIDQLTYCLLHFGIISAIYVRPKRDEKWNIEYVLSISGINIKKFYNGIGYKCFRKQKIFLDAIKNKKRWMCQDDNIPGILPLMIDLVKQYGSFKDDRISLKTLIKRKNVSFDLAEIFLNHFSNIDDNKVNIIKKLFNRDIYYDTVESITDSECITYDVHVPETHEYCANGFFSHNSKIRGFRANIIIADEFAVIDENIFDVVIRGFAATTKTPIDEAKKIAFKNKIKSLNLDEESESMIIDGIQESVGNQIIHSGTAYYAFNHFAKRFETWKAIIYSKGDPHLVSEIFGGEHNIPKNFDYKDYVVIRVPYNHLPEGLLDSRQLANARATLPKNIFNMEYAAIFVADSDGFFARSLIELCTVGPNKPIQTPDGDITFTPLMFGVKNRKYVIGIDPAAERDNLSIVVLEVWPNHARVVYCWSINKAEFKRRKKIADIEAEDYYDYCCNKIRQVVSRFKPIRILMDSQGGGYSIAEMLRNSKLIDKDKKEFPIYEVIDSKDPKYSDMKSDGPHILQLISQSSDYNSRANLALHKSLETRTLLFPAFDTVKMQSALIAEKEQNITIDTFEECVYNIEEIKNELSTIQRTETPTGKERFDTPSVTSLINTEGRTTKGRLRKDRYTAILLSHFYVYENEFINDDPVIDYENVAGNFQKIKEINPAQGMYVGLGVPRMKNAEFYTKGRESPFGAVKRNEKI